MDKLTQLKELIDKNNGVILTSDVIKNNIQRTYISNLLSANYIKRVSRGVYIKNDENISDDEMFNLQARCKYGVFSHNTALFIFGLTDRTPIKYTMTVPTGYNAHSFKDDPIEFKYLKKDLAKIGVITKESPISPFIIKTYNPEATICHLITSKDKTDSEIFAKALNNYVNYKNRDFILLMEYAKIFKIEKKVREYMEVLV